jgi:hypothetical protein
MMKDPIAEARTGGRQGWLAGWLFLLRFVVPPVLVWVLWNSVPATIGSVVDLFASTP